jgi:uncharacterized membrane protein
MAEVPPPAPPPQSPPPLPPQAAGSIAHLHPRSVPLTHALVWFEDAMQLVKRSPATWLALGLVTLASDLLLNAMSEFGAMLGKIIVPLVACGMLYAAAATDGGGRPLLRHAMRAFVAPAPAIAAIIAVGLVTVAAEWLAGWWIADVNLFARDGGGADLSFVQIAGIYAIVMLASLPVTFVPFHVLFERARVGAAFAASWRGFVLNTTPLLVYSAASLVLFGFGIATMGIGLVFVLPLCAAASYAAWKDVFAVDEAPRIEAA